MINEIVLPSCRTQPIAAYLKALGVFRVIAEQADPNAVCWWQSDTRRFVLGTRLTEEELVNFFVNEYKPTPIVSPWNRGSGFITKTNKDCWLPIDQSTSERFALYRETIKEIRRWPEINKFAGTKSGSKKAKAVKLQILNLCRNRLPDEVLPWLDAVYAITSRNEEGYFSQNLLLGSGGNDGNLEFSVTYVSCINNLFFYVKNQDLTRYVDSSLFGCPFSDKKNKELKFGMFTPNKAGGVNRTSKAFKKEDVKGNPWDFVFCVEGTLFFQTSASHRLATEETTLTAPFTVHSIEAGFNSEAIHEDNNKMKGEIWLPVWHRPVGFRELGHLFREGRTVLDRKRVHNGRDFARAVRSLGVVRGLAGFERMVIREHRGQSSIIKPAGYYEARYSPSLALLDNLDYCLLELGKRKKVASIRRIQNQIDRAVFACCQNPAPERFTEILRCVGQADRLFSMTRNAGDNGKETKLKKPLFGLSLDWLSVADDNSVEFRLAAALASIRQEHKVGGFRANLSSVDPQHPKKWGNGKTQHYWYGNNVYQRLSGVLNKRLLDTEHNGLEKLPLNGKIRLNPQDAILLATGRVDENKLEDLLFAMSIMDWREDVNKDLIQGWRDNPVVSEILPRSWCLFKLFFLPGLTIKEKEAPKGDVGLLNLIKGNRLREATRIAILKLVAKNLNPYRVEYRDDFNGQCLAASMLVSVVRKDFVWKVLGDVNFNQSKEEKE